MVGASLLEQVDILPPQDRLDLLGHLRDSLDVAPADHELREARLGLEMYRANPGRVRQCADVERDLRDKYL